MVPKIQDVVLNDILHLHDEVRGTESGFTGRVNLNKASAGFWKKPIFGYGFRVSSQAGVEFQAIHSGYLKVLVETGFVGAFLIVGAVIIEAGRRFFVVQRIRDLPPTALPNINLPDTIRLNAMAFATMCMTLTLWLYEPLYVNLGSVTSLLFWLMIVSPTYVTAQGLPLRKLSY
jgi:O-antigen ligase